MLQGVDRRRYLFLEVGAVLTTYYLPLLFSAVLAIALPRAMPELSPWLDDTYRVTSTIGPVLITLFVAWSSGDQLRKFGLQPTRWWLGAQAILAIILLAFVGYPIYSSVWYGIFGADKGASKAVVALNGPMSPLDWAVRIPALLVLAFVEEFVMRGYLIARLIELTRRPWLSLLLSSALFSLYHVYQGFYAVPWTFLMGCLFALSLMVTRSIWPGVIGHFLMNLIITLQWQAK